MKPVEKKQLVMIGIRRKGEAGFRLKMVKAQAESDKINLPVHNYSEKQISLTTEVLL